MKELRVSQGANGSDVAAALEFAVQAAEPELLRVIDERGAGKPTEAFVLVAGGGQRVHDLTPFLDKFRDRPVRAKGFSELATVDSLVRHVNRFKRPETVVFADVDRGGAQLVAVYDYHAAGDAGLPGWGEFGACYQPQHSPAWLRWTALAGKAIGGEQFAELLESAVFDVVLPDEDMDLLEAVLAIRSALGGEPGSPSQLIGLSRNLTLNASVSVTEVRQLSTGEGQLLYAETHRDGQGAPVKVPGWFLLRIPVFTGGQREVIPVRLRYRLKGGALSWTYEVHRVEEVVEAALGRVVYEVESATGVPVFVGTRGE